jgi:hypothetical protein
MEQRKCTPDLEYYLKSRMLRGSHSPWCMKSRLCIDLHTMTLEDSDISAPTSRKTSSLNWIVEYMVEYDRVRIMESLALYVHKDGICQHSSPENHGSRTTQGSARSRFFRCRRLSYLISESIWLRSMDSAALPIIQGMVQYVLCTVVSRSIAGKAGEKPWNDIHRHGFVTTSNWEFAIG